MLQACSGSHQLAGNSNCVNLMLAGLLLLCCCTTSFKVPLLLVTHNRWGPLLQLAFCKLSSKKSLLHAVCVLAHRRSRL
jgi:hypothetical protein